MKQRLFLFHFFLFALNSLLFCYCYYFDFILDIDLSIFISSVSVLTILYHFLFFEKSLFSIINLFNGFCILFLYGNVINYIVYNVDDFGIYNLMEGANIPFRDFTSSIFLINLGISLINMTYLKFESFKNSRIIIHNKIPKDIILFYIIFSILTSVKFFLELKHINKIGYVNFYMNGLGSLNYYSPLIKNAHTLLLLFYGIILSYYPRKKIFLIISMSFCFIMMLNSLKGARVLFLLPFLFSFWFYSKFYQKITFSGNVLKIITICFVLLIGSKTLKSSRLNYDNSIFNISDLPSLVLKETGSTQKLVAVFLSKRDNIDSNYPFILEPILYPLFYINNFDIYKAGHSKELVETRNSLNHIISYLLNPSYYLNGNAVGSSMIAESFQYGLPFFIIILVLFGRFLCFVQNIKINSKFIYLLPLLFNAAVFAARDSPFPNTWILVKLTFLYALFYLIRKILKYSSKKPSFDKNFNHDNIYNL